ncbi:uncharacterized protein [Chelonus insularis]|uniref:uncharacterized protein n=1 Tax=Chelonus insularis TaxID=460826 RepID=UPI00158CD59A|nr:uncharacterized protein LOC118067923 [Chelonus insularis]
MESLWNQLILKRPPTTTCYLASDNLSANSFLKLLHEIYNEISSQDIIHKEAAVLSRFIYRMKKKFRHDKGLKSIEKVNRALLNYLHISLENEYKYLIDNTLINNKLTKLPTRQMLQYVLTRTQGYCMLLYRIEKVSIEAAQFFKTRIQLGQAWTFSAFIYSIISRIWIWSRHLIQKCCIWYNQMFPFLSQLSQIGIDWLPENYRLPSDLKNWLSIPWIEEPIESLFTNKNSVDIFDLIKHQHALNDETNLTEKISKNENEETSINNIINETIMDLSNDIGVPISRGSLISKSIESPEMPEKLIITNIKSKDDLHQLLTLDYYPGMDKLRWRIMKKIISKNLMKISKSTDIKKHKIILNKMDKILHSYINE